VIDKATVLQLTSLTCGWCREKGAPEHGSGPDRVGGWVSGFLHRVGRRFVKCAMQAQWYAAK
jgi:hypothetical protein